MTIEKRIDTFCALGKRLQRLPADELSSLIDKIKSENAWFTSASIEMALDGIITMLDEAKLNTWLSNYKLTEQHTPKTVALIMAGNIPLVGFHDLLCVLISGHHAQVKPSSKDSASFHFIVRELTAIEPDMQKKITTSDRLKDFDAVIATGSDNSSRYFDYYFGKYPNIIRRNRTSCAILRGDESEKDFRALAKDVFSYFGLGCRNVSKLYVPTGYNFSPLLDSWEMFNEIRHHHKYTNNYDYQKSIMLVNGVPFLDNGFVMITQSEKTVSPISVLHYEYYTSQQDLENKITSVQDKLQCVVGSPLPASIPFGQAQFPELWDYADGVDTLKFLLTL
jgi:hypothetical protein